LLRAPGGGSVGLLATTIFGVWAAPGRKNGGTPVLLSSTAMSVGEGAKCGFQLGVDRVALAEDPWQAEQG
jgi:hypothetical protein